MELKDHMITQEDFKIVKCNNCGFHYTNPVPVEENIGSYYKGEQYISHSSTSKGLVNKMYSVVRNITLKQKLKLVKSLSKGTEILDIGAGTGHFLNICKSNGFSVQGLEPDADARAFAKKEMNLDLEDISTLTSISSGSKDIITMWHVLEHVYHLKRDLEEIVRVLKKDGTFVVAVPNMDSADAEKYGAFWAAYDVPRHLYHFQKATIEKLMNEFGLKLEKVIPMKFDAYYVAMLSEKYKQGNLLSGFISGFLSNAKGGQKGYSSQIYIFRKR